MIDTLQEKLSNLVAERSAIGFSLGFDLGDAGYLHVDGRAAPMTVSREQAEADTVVVISASDATDLIEGRLNPMQAYMSGRLQVKGDLSSALQLAQLFS